MFTSSFVPYSGTPHLTAAVERFFESGGTELSLITGLGGTRWWSRVPETGTGVWDGCTISIFCSCSTFSWWGLSRSSAVSHNGLNVYIICLLEEKIYQFQLGKRSNMYNCPVKLFVLLPFAFPKNVNYALIESACLFFFLIPIAKMVNNITLFDYSNIIPHLVRAKQSH